MNEAWKIFFEMYFSNGADIFVFVIAPMLWVSSMFIARRHINCWQVSKTTCFLVMYGHVFINLLVLLQQGLAGLKKQIRKSLALPRKIVIMLYI